MNIKTNKHMSIKRNFAGLLIAAFLPIALTCCKADIDFDNIDPSAKVAMGVALPVGTITARLGDFIGDTTIQFIKVNDNGVYQLEASYNYTKQFHEINLSNYLTTVHSKLMMKEKVQEQYPAAPVNPVTGDVTVVDPGDNIVLSFPVGMKFNNINNNLSNERLDKMLISSAQFGSKFSQNFGLEFDRIKSLDILLPSNMPRSAGQVVNVPLTGYSYGDDIPIVVDNFEILLLKDPSQPYDATTNPVTDSVTFTMRFTIRLNGSDVITLNDASAFDYDFTIGFIEYDALYGDFSASEELKDHDEMDVSDAWQIFSGMDTMKIPLADPQLRLTLTTHIASPFHVHIDSLMAKNNPTGKTMYSEFNPGGSKPTQFDMDLPHYLNPNTAPLTDSVTNIIVFNKDTGNIDKLFGFHPDVLGYSFDFHPYFIPEEGIYQQRLTKNTNIDVEATVVIPFIFNEGISLSIKDTIDAALDSISLQQLAEDVEILDSTRVNNVSLVITAQSYIPFNVKAIVHFYDKNYNDVGVTINDDNEILIPGPTDYANGVIQNPREYSNVISIDQSDLDKLTNAKHIGFVFELKDADIKEADKASVFPVSLTTDTKLTVKVAVSADVEAYLKLPFGDQLSSEQQ